MWKTIAEMFSSLNDSCNYLVLRNYEKLDENKLIENHDDIDILCDKRSIAIKAMRAVSRCSNDFVHLQSCIGGYWIKIDLRVVGDGYYDMQWATDMLNTKVLYKDLFYVMNDENYYYSLAFHGLFHKKIMKDEYFVRLENIANAIGIVFSRQNLKKDLLRYMAIKKYRDTGYRSK